MMRTISRMRSREEEASSDGSLPVMMTKMRMIMTMSLHRETAGAADASRRRSLHR